MKTPERDEPSLVDSIAPVAYVPFEYHTNTFRSISFTFQLYREQNNTCCQPVLTSMGVQATNNHNHFEIIHKAAF